MKVLLSDVDDLFLKDSKDIANLESLQTKGIL